MNIKLLGMLLIMIVANNLLIAQENKENDPIETDSLLIMPMSSGSYQEGGYYDNTFTVIPNSPTVSELMKYVDTPVDLSRGLPSIDIPLYTIDCGDLSLPISLSYHAGGIKVDQIASWVGLGWSLNAGGAISYENLDYTLRENSRNDCYQIPTKEYYADYSLLSEHDGYMLETYCLRATIPQLFSYNFVNFTGQHLYSDNTCHDLKGSRNLFLKHNLGNIIATDRKGVNYYFGDQETNITYSAPAYINNGMLGNPWFDRFDLRNEQQKNGAYLLSKITSAFRTDSISFTYRSEQESFISMTKGKLSSSTSYANWQAREFSDYKDEFRQIAPSFTKQWTRCATKKLQEITATNGVRVVFTADLVRTDLKGNYIDSSIPAPKALTKIEVFNKQNERIRMFEFEYDYFVSYISHPYYPTNDKRLRLKRLKEYAGTDTTPRIHSFSYYGDLPGEPELPYRGAFGGHDILGYCNGRPSDSDARNWRKSFHNSYTSSSSIYDNVLGNASFPDGGNLYTNAAYTHAYSLKEITYPSGGKKKFVYEPHDLSRWQICGGLTIKKIVNYYSTTDSTVQEYEFQGGYLKDPIKIIRKRGIDPYLGYYNTLTSNGMDIQILYDISNTPFTTLASYTGPGVRYGFARELINDEERVEYHYTTPADYPIVYSARRLLVEEDLSVDPLLGYNWRPFKLLYNGDMNEENHEFIFNRISPDYMHGHLQQKTTITKELLIDEYYEYDFQERSSIPMMEIHYGPKVWARTPWWYYEMSLSTYHTGKALLVGKTTNWYNHDALETWDYFKTESETYEYNSYDQLSKAETTTSLGESISREVRYATDINNSLYREMIQKKLIDYPIEQIKKIDGKVTEANLITYKKVNNTMYLPEKVYDLKLTSPLSALSLYNGSVNSNYGEALGIINNYTPKGKVRYLRDKEQTNVVYLWGYDNRYPIAEVRNATLSQVTAKISETEMNTIAAKSAPTEQDWTKINTLKTISGAHVTVMKYKPLVGIKSICAPNDETIYYDYNSFDEMKEIYKMKDGTKKTLETYDYNYSND